MCAVAIVVATLALVQAVLAPAMAGSAATVVTATVPSATNISIDPSDGAPAGDCMAGTDGITSLGLVLPGGAATSAADCTVVFGSSNDTAMLRAFQTDRAGAAMTLPSAGEMDTAFDGDGVAEFSATGVGDGFGGVAVQDDGAIVAAGHVDTGTEEDLMVARYLPDGSLDTTAFNAPLGYVTLDINGTEGFGSVRIDPADGGIVAVGNTQGASMDMVVARFDADGQLDTSFAGGAGFLVLDPLGGDDDANDFELLADGAIVIGGHASHDIAVLKVTPGGQVDSAFGTSTGFTRWPMGGWQSGSDVEVDSQGRLVIVGSANSDGFVARLLPDGTVDTSFSAPDGQDTLDVPRTTCTAWEDNLNGAVILPDDGVVAVGRTCVEDPGDHYDYLVASWDDTGALDTSFGEGLGYVVLNLWQTAEIAYDVVRHGDGRLTVVGRAYVVNTDLAVFRLMPDGRLDTSFGGGDGAMSLHYVNNNGSSDIALTADGGAAISGWTSTTGGVVYKLAGGTPVPDYADDVGDAAGDDWGTTNAALFGACLRQVSGGAATDGTTRVADVDNDCAATDADPWFPLAVDGAAPTAKIAHAGASGTTTATASLRFGMRAAPTQAPGGYLAPLTFEVVAPNA